MGQKKHVLIVEDSPDLQSLLGQLLEGEGYAISQAYNGREALEQLQKMPRLPDLILLDLMMPVMDGVEFRQAQRSDPRLAPIPAVVMTADANSRARIQDLGVADFVRKPIQNVDDLLAAVARARL